MAAQNMRISAEINYFLWQQAEITGYRVINQRGGEMCSISSEAKIPWTMTKKG